MTYPKKLIEVSLPLEAINNESAREKSIRHGHPSTLHLWWSRKPLATTRAVIWASLVDDPSSHPELFPTEKEQIRERKRLHNLLAELVKWENSGNETLLSQAKAEIAKYVAPPPSTAQGSEFIEFLDPFSGGGSIPLEAQRLGLKVHAHDLNPVAVLINKAMIEIPPRFAGMPPVNPEACKRLGADREWKGAQGLAEDVRYYGEWMKQEAFRRIGHLYPKVQVPEEQGGGEATVIAWKWARTVKCPNPACGCEMPLTNSFELSKKKGKEAWVEPHCADGRVSFEVHYGGKPTNPGTVNRRGAVCPCCGTAVSFDYIRECGRAGKMSAQMMAVVAEGERERTYLAPDIIQRKTAQVERPYDFPDAELPKNPRDFKTPNYGLYTYAALFTSRQLTALTTLSELVTEAQRKATEDALAAGMADDESILADGGSGALAYGQALGVYLAFIVDKLTDYHSSVCSWHSSRDLIRNTFGRQAIPMVWDYAEGNPFCSSAGSFDNMLEWIFKCLQALPANANGMALQQDAQADCGLRNLVVSSDPPYYDNIGYADLSDYFYIWLRQSLKSTYPQLFRTLLVPKIEELVATPYRFKGSREVARHFFEKGMLQACRQIYSYAREDVPVTIYYAYKQSEADEQGEASTGWETMLSAIIHAGFAITGTWPMRTEMSNRSVASNANALASSIVLVCRKRPEDAPACTRRTFLAELRRELRPALLKMQTSNIAPVDMAQASIGPGMAVYSRYAKVLEADGSELTIRKALQIINKELDTFFTEQEGDMDEASRVCLALYSQCAFNDLNFGDADVLARAKNTSIEALVRLNLAVAEKGIVRLSDRKELPAFAPASEQSLWLVTQQIAHAMQEKGVEGSAQIVSRLRRIAPDRVKTLAYRLYSLADQKGWTQEAYIYNALVVSWNDIQAKAMTMETTEMRAGSLIDFGG